MKLVVTIPAHNEEKSLARVISTIPKNIEDITEIQTVVINDGSTDDTAQIALKHGAALVNHTYKKGLAKTFQDGLDAALQHGADFIVNIDGDGQYDSGEIGVLLHKLRMENADMVISDRHVRKLSHMPLTKKYGNILGSFFLRLSTGLKINDASSGFRALTRETALRMQILSSHTYTHETIIQAAFWSLKVINCPASFNAREHGESKLISGVFSHIWKSLGTILRSLATYKPFSKFFTLGVITILASILDVLFTHIGSFAAISFFSLGTMLILLGFIADLIVGNRRIQAEMLYRLKKEAYKKEV